MKTTLVLILAVSTGVAVVTSIGLIIFICCCMRARRLQRRQKRREQLERALAVMPLQNDFYQQGDDDEYRRRTTIGVHRQDPIADESASDELQTDEAPVQAAHGSMSPDNNYLRSQSWVPEPSSRLVAVDPQRRKTLAVTSLTPSSSDSSLASYNSEPDLEKPGRDSEWMVYQVSEKPVLNFSLYHSSQDSTLFVCLKSVSGLARKYYPGCSSFLKVSLLPKYKDGFRTETVRKSLHPHFNESFQFCALSLSEAQSSFLKVKLYIVEKWNRKDRFNGEVFAECLHLLEKGDILLEFQRAFSTKRTKLPKKNLKRLSLPCMKQMRSKSTSEGTSKRPYLGDLFVTLQYQSSAERLKILLRRAQNLLVDSVLPGIGDVYLSIRLLKHGETIADYNTQRRSGTSPVWNQPFLFYPRHDEIGNYSLMLALFHGKRLGSDEMVGKVEIGPKAEGTGATHWSEMLEPRATEVAKWHRIKPPFS